MLSVSGEQHTVGLRGLSLHQKKEEETEAKPG